MQRMKELIEKLNEASRAYYSEDKEIISNFEYDKLYDELAMLEGETGIVMAGSPTQKIGYTVLGELPKETHAEPMLSLDKTKSVAELAKFLGDKKGLLSWKLDGLTVALIYSGGKLTKAVTRGNGEVGEVITENAKTFINLPLAIPYKGRLVIRGEAVISYSDFEEINRTLPELDAKYKNPRNLCSGSVRQLDTSVTASRRVRLIAFALVSCDEEYASRAEEMRMLRAQGFETVFAREVTGESIEGAVREFAGEVATSDLPSDGLVLIYDDIAYGKSLGRTAKFPRDAIAFKWRDEIKVGELLEIEWSPSRTGLINPIAVFTPLLLEGTSVSRASVHNVSILKSLMLDIGDRIAVYKANMIIPQIERNVSYDEMADKSAKKHVAIPETCPVCGGKTQIKKDADVEVLICTNPTCPAKMIKAFELFVSRNALNIDGMSGATIEKFVGAGFIKEWADFFKLDRYRDKIVAMEGFGEKSYDKLMAATEKARKVKPAAFLYGLGIPGIGLANAKLIVNEAMKEVATGDEKQADIWSVAENLSAERLLAIDGLGEVLANNYTKYFADEASREKADAASRELTFDLPQTASSDMAGVTVVITGSLENYASRDELRAIIEERGGKVSGSVSSKSTCLVNNDITSTSGKNKKAKELGVPIMSETEFMEKYNL